MRWYVQVDGMYAHELRVEDAVENYLLDVGAIQPDADCVQSDPGLGSRPASPSTPTTPNRQLSSPGSCSPRLWRAPALVPMRICWMWATPFSSEGSGGLHVTAPPGRGPAPFIQWPWTRVGVILIGTEKSAANDAAVQSLPSIRPRYFSRYAGIRSAGGSSL
jgi:hypothetical protein